MTWLDDLQRRLAIAGARSLGHEFADHIGRTFRGESQDVWGTATSEQEAGFGTAPECAWCPVCRAIRMVRDSRPDLAARVGETAGTLMAAAQDAVAAVDAALSRLPEPAPPGTATVAQETAKPALRETAPPQPAPEHAVPAAPEPASGRDLPESGPPPSSNGQQG